MGHVSIRNLGRDTIIGQHSIGLLPIQKGKDGQLNRIALQFLQQAQIMDDMVTLQIHVDTPHG